jgi:peptidyl-prolyl cis-trans isomerase C
MVPAGASAADKAGKLKAIEGARTRVLKGEDFAAVAREVSEDQYSAPKGGDLDFFQKGQMVPEFEKVAFSSKVGAVSNVFESKFGYHFLKVTDTKPAGKVPLEEIKEKISQFLQNKSREKAIRDFIEKLEQQAQIKYNIPIPATPVASNAPAAASTSNAAPAPAPAGAK